MSRVTQKGPLWYFYQNDYFYIFWMYIILRLLCENISRIAVKISFLWGLKYGVHAAASFSINVTSWCSRRYTQALHCIAENYTDKFLLLLFWKWSSYLSHSKCLVVIMKFYTVRMFLHALRNFLNQNAFQANTCQPFYRENMTSFLNYVTTTLRAIFAWRGSYRDICQNRLCPPPSGSELKSKDWRSPD